MTKEEAKALFLKSKIYRFAAVFFGFAGVLVFVYFYMEKESGNFFLIFTNPLAVALMVLPFLPAFVFSFLARRLEAKLKAFFDSL